MINSTEKFFQSMLDSLKSFAQSCENLLSRFLQRCLDFIEACRIWLDRTLKAITDYLSELLPALGRIIKSLFYLALFYVPGIILFLWGIFTDNIILWGIGILYILFITLIGLGYKKRNDANKSLQQMGKSGTANR